MACMSSMLNLLANSARRSPVQLRGEQAHKGVIQSQSKTRGQIFPTLPF